MCPRASLLATAVRTLLTDTFHAPSATTGRRSTKLLTWLRRGNPFKWSPPPRCTPKPRCLGTQATLRAHLSTTCFDGCDSGRDNVCWQRLWDPSRCRKGWRGLIIHPSRNTDGPEARRAAASSLSGACDALSACSNALMASTFRY